MAKNREDMEEVKGVADYIEAKKECVEHLAYAYSILFDYEREFEGDFLMSMETAETLVRAAIRHILDAANCLGEQIENYRSKD